MTKTGTGRVVSVGKARTRYITVPSSVSKDSQFPFEDGEQVKITIDEEKKRLFVEKDNSP
jgi:co-chaperonin GroES (HSP10)